MTERQTGHSQSVNAVFQKVMRRAISTRGALRRSGKCALAAVVLWVALSPLVQAQLAITEVMPYPAMSSSNTKGWDFWELTNFGTNAVDLSDWEFADDQDSWVPLPLGIVIEPNESIVFFKTNKLDESAEQFKAWWGLAPESRVYVLAEMAGLSRFGDSARLRDAGGALVDRVDFGSAFCGVTLTCDCQSGDFGRDSALEDGCSFLAVGAPEIGSPCTNCCSVPLRVVVPPADVTAAAGCQAEFSVVAKGMPPPRYQWLYNGVAIDGATSSALRFTSVEPSDAGIYCVVVRNGLEELPPLCATLTVFTNWSAPTVSSPPKNCTVMAAPPGYAGQTATFTAGFCAYPPPTYQWFSNGIAMEFETSPTLTIWDCQLEMSGTTFCIQASNEVGVVSVCATLTVLAPDSLRITEAMARSITNSPLKKDWIELTNFGTNSVDLSGFRYIASRGAFSFEGCSVIPDGVVVRPRESIILADARTRDEFVAWWGATNLPQDVQVITWRGWGISHLGGEAITLWDPSTEEPFQTIHQVFTSQFTEGVSSYFDSDGCEFGCVSDPADRGTFFAAQGGELGSPSYEAAPNVHIVRDGNGVAITGRSRVNRKYTLEFKNDLQDQAWTSLPPSQTAAGAAVVFRDGTLVSRRFYRLLEELP